MSEIAVVSTAEGGWGASAVGVREGQRAEQHEVQRDRDEHRDDREGRPLEDVVGATHVPSSASDPAPRLSPEPMTTSP